MIAPLAGSCATPALAGLTRSVCARAASTPHVLSRPTFVCVLAALVLRNAAVPRSFATSSSGVAVRQRCRTVILRLGGIAVPLLARLFYAAAASLQLAPGAWLLTRLTRLLLLPQGNTALFMGPPSKVKNENVDDFATYLAKRKAAEEGRAWQPPGGAAAPAAKAAPSYSPAPSYQAPQANQGYAPQNAGDVPYDAAWGGTPKAHTKDPTPVSAENNSLGKKGAIASGESFEEYMRKRAAGGK